MESTLALIWVQGRELEEQQRLFDVQVQNPFTADIHCQKESSLYTLPEEMRMKHSQL